MFLTKRTAPANRIGFHLDDAEYHFSEAAVMLAMAEWLFAKGAEEVRMHPDGMHTKQFNVNHWLLEHGFNRTATTGRAGISGTFVRGEQTLIVYSRPGLGDVVADIDGESIEIETKGGCVNTRHPGQLSRLRKGLHEAVGQLMGSPRQDVRLIAAVPFHAETQKLADRLIGRCLSVGIELALVEKDGNVRLISA